MIKKQKTKTEIFVEENIHINIIDSSFYIAEK